MVSSDSDNDEYDDLEFEGASDGDDNIDEDILGALEEDLAAAAAAEGTEGEEVRRHCCSSCSSLTTTQDTDSTTSYGGSDDDDGEEEHLPPHRDLEQMLTQTLQETTLPSKPPSPATESPLSAQGMCLALPCSMGSHILRSSPTASPNTPTFSCSDPQNEDTVGHFLAEVLYSRGNMCYSSSLRNPCIGFLPLHDPLHHRFGRRLYT